MFGLLPRHERDDGTPVGKEVTRQCIKSIGKRTADLLLIIIIVVVFLVVVAAAHSSYTSLDSYYKDPPTTFRC
jgi:hypothetical protein